MRCINIFIPYSINYSLIRNKVTKHNYIYFYNEYYYFSINFTNTNLFINKNTNNIKIENITFNDKNMLLNNELNLFLFSWDNLFFNKIKFTGKGFKLKKKTNNLFLFFNRAHKCFFIGNNVILVRLSKNKIMLLKNNFNNLIHDSKLIRGIRSNNIFTKRGLRFSRQILLKKKGKTASK